MQRAEFIRERPQLDNRFVASTIQNVHQAAHDLLFQLFMPLRFKVPAVFDCLWDRAKGRGRRHDCVATVA